jgi:Tol biopolymer transport system component
MSLTSGTRLGPYEIVAPIGAGGMGEVYRARDTKLNRDVAIKVLPEIFASDPDRLARFTREAQTLAALNHPNIAQIFGIEESSGTRALVMELVEGDDVSAVIARGPIPLAEALPIARQIADALEVAHEQGIIHRDLKPANVKVRPDGTVKVLDFGLAKALDTNASDATADAANSPTLTARATQMGMIIGTAAYMAPEQAKGRPVDRRADIWAFGCVVYEMLSGRRPFPGEDVSDTLAAVLRADIDWTALPADTPRALRDLVVRCLDRNLRTRLQAIGEARVAIERLIAAPPDTDTPPAGLPAPAAPPARWRTAVIVGVSVVATAIVATAVARWSRPTSQPAAVRRYLLPGTVPIVAGAGARGLSLSPNGRKLVFVSDQKLLVWELDQLEPRVLAGAGSRLGQSAEEIAPVWSPDGQAVAYAADGKLWRIPAQDGPPAMICSLPAPFHGAAWDDDDRIVFATTRGPMYQVSARGGEPKVLLPLDPATDVDFHQPTVLPQGRGVLYTAHRREGADTLEVFSAGTRKVVLRVEGKVRANPQVLNLAQYSVSGHLVYRMDQGNVGIWAVPFSLDRLETTGEPFLVTSRGVSPSVAQDGSLAYVPAQDDQPVQLALFRRDGTLERTLGEPSRGMAAPVFSPDGQRIAYVAGNAATDVWVWDLAKGSATRVTVTPDDEADPVWIPGPNALAFDCVAADGPAVCTKPADGSGETKVLAHHASGARVSPDGRSLLVTTNGQVRRGVLAIDLANPSAVPKEFEMSPDDRQPLGFTSDGRYAIYSAYQSGTPKTYLRPFPAGEGLWEVPNWTIDGPRLRFGGRSVMALVPRGKAFAVIEVPIDTTRGVAFGAARDLVTGVPALVDAGGFDVAPDGTRMAGLLRKDSRGATSGIVVVLNWAAGAAKAR